MSAWTKFIKTVEMSAIWQAIAFMRRHCYDSRDKGCSIAFAAIDISDIHCIAYQTVSTLILYWHIKANSMRPQSKWFYTLVAYLCNNSWVDGIQPWKMKKKHTKAQISVSRKFFNSCPGYNDWFNSYKFIQGLQSMNCKFTRVFHVNFSHKPQTTSGLSQHCWT